MRLLPLLALLVLAGGAGAAAGGRSACSQPQATAAYTRSVDRALRSGRDVWGEALMRSASGPTYDSVRRHLAPLLLGEQRGGSLTRSGVYYLPFGQPSGPFGTGTVFLHVADGSEIVADRAGGPSLRVEVEGEPYGACLARLKPPRLAGGYLPILETAYVGPDGRRYEQESFAARAPGLTSFLSVKAPSEGRVRLVSSPGGALAGAKTVYAEWRGGRPRAIDRETYQRARASVIRFWEGRLAEGTTFVAPERRVLDAERSLLIQNLTMGWRYSIGNAYEEFSYPESPDVAGVMGEYGFQAPNRATLAKALAMRPSRYPNWQMGEKLLDVARYSTLYGDPGFVASATPTLARYLEALERSFERATGLLEREQYSSDIPDRVYGLHAQAMTWQGLNAAASMWDESGRRDLAARARRLASRLEAGLRRAVERSQRRLPDGSLFVPTRLLDDVEPYRRVTDSRDGSYWNLVVPYALASGLFARGSTEAEGSLRYMLTHGSRLLGLVRAGAFALYGKTPKPPASGTDNVYGLSVARFLADNDEPDQLVLSLYGALAAGMTPGTFVAGEAASVAPLDGRLNRSMYLPPNSGANGAFLETLRLMLVHETATGLELAFATPRAWLRPGRRIAVQGAPTAFGRVSFELRSEPGLVRIAVEIPPRARSVRLRLRLPRPGRITSVSAGRLVSADTIDLSGRSGRFEFVARRTPS